MKGAQSVKVIAALPIGVRVRRPDRAARRCGRGLAGQLFRGLWGDLAVERRDQILASVQQPLSGLQATSQGKIFSA